MRIAGFLSHSRHDVFLKDQARELMQLCFPRSVVRDWGSELRLLTAVFEPRQQNLPSGHPSARENHGFLSRLLTDPSDLSFHSSSNISRLALVTRSRPIVSRFNISPISSGVDVIEIVYDIYAISNSGSPCDAYQLIGVV